MWNVLITCYNDCLFKKSLRSHPYVSKQGIFELTDWVIYRNQELEVSISEGGGFLHGDEAGELEDVVIQENRDASRSL